MEQLNFSKRVNTFEPIINSSIVLSVVFSLIFLLVLQNQKSEGVIMSLLDKHYTKHDM